MRKAVAKVVPQKPLPQKKKPRKERVEFLHPTTTVEVKGLKSHPRNYKQHPEDQLNHIIQSIRDHGFYRNVVVARGDVILAGHGVVQAARKMGIVEIPVIRLDLDPDSTLALKIVAGDNEIPHLAEVDDRMLTEMLKDIAKTSELLGTGFDASQLSALVFVSRPASEIQDLNEANEWLGMPAYEDGGTFPKLTITFKTVEDRDRFRDLAKLKIVKVAGLTWSCRWPEIENEDASSIRFEVTE